MLARNSDLIRLRAETRAVEEKAAEEAEAVRRVRQARESAAKEAKLARRTEEKAAAMGNRAHQREQAWKLYTDQLKAAAAATAGGLGEGEGGGGATAKALWGVVAPAAFLVSADEAVNDILETCNRSVAVPAAAAAAAQSPP